MNHIDILIQSFRVVPPIQREIWDYNPHNAGKCWQWVYDDPRVDRLREIWWNNGDPLSIDVDSILTSCHTMQTQEGDE